MKNGVKLSFYSCGEGENEKVFDGYIVFICLARFDGACRNSPFAEG
jgi:hypothetical protein